MIFILDISHMVSDRQLLSEGVRLLVKKTNDILSDEEIKSIHLKNFAKTVIVWHR